MKSQLTCPRKLYAFGKHTLIRSFFDERTGARNHEIKGEAKTDEATSRLLTASGVGPMFATTVQAFAPPMEEFYNGREFAA